MGMTLTPDVWRGLTAPAQSREVVPVIAPEQEAGRRFALCHQAMPARTDNGSRKNVNCTKNRQEQPVVGGVGNGVTLEALGQDLN